MNADTQPNKPMVQTCAARPRHIGQPFGSCNEQRPEEQDPNHESRD